MAIGVQWRALTALDHTAHYAQNTREEKSPVTQAPAHIDTDVAFARRIIRGGDRSEVTNKLGGRMARRIAYWTSTVIVAVMLLMALSYLTGAAEVVSGFARAGYPQHLRIILGVAKPAAAIVLLIPGLALLKEWAYAGAAFTWMMAVVAHYAAGDGPQTWGVPLVLLALLIISYATRPAGRRLASSSASAFTS